MKASVINILNQAKTDIQSNMAKFGINASGRTSASLVVEEYENGVRLVSRGESIAPFPTLEVGRKGGKVPKGFYYTLIQWSRDKGISFATESERKTFAYFLSQKIASEGTERHRNPNTEVYTPIIQSVRKEIEKIFFAKIIKEIKIHVK